MRWRLVGVCALLALAGCNFAGGPVTEAETLTAAPVPTATATETPSAAEALPPGIDTTGVYDEDVLVAAHVAAARGTSWYWREHRERTQVYRNTSLTTNESQNVTFVDPTTYRRRAQILSTRVGAELRFYQDLDTYADGEAVYRTWISPNGGDQVYDRDHTPEVSRAFVGFGTGPIREYLPLDTATVSRADVPGGEYYEVVGRRSSVPDLGPVNSSRVRLVVREDGLVRSLNATHVVDRGDVYISVHYNFTYRGIGTTTVERPGWLETARDRTDP